MKNIKKVLTVALAICFAGGNILTAPVWTFAAVHDVRTEIKDNIETVQEAEESPTLQDPENLKSEEVASITEDQALDPDPAAENSWRYSDGQPVSMPSTYADDPNAWEKVDGQFVNSNGEVIPGACEW